MFCAQVVCVTAVFGRSSLPSSRRASSARAQAKQPFNCPGVSTGLDSHQATFPTDDSLDAVHSERKMRAARMTCGSDRRQGLELETACVWLS
jgi:hypothetical protein